MDIKKITEHLTKRLIILSLIISLVGTWIITVVIFENKHSFSTKIIFFIFLLIISLLSGVKGGYIKKVMGKK
tara:strand:+ start:63 stop:278 length:216 start_codon:yes stop_codon:yes gene_type:complete